jgi:deoxyribose-phosphate aldolase
MKSPTATKREIIMMTTGSLQSLAKTIDHSLLHPTLTDQGIREGCQLAKHYGVASVCLKPYSIPQAKSLLTGSEVGICAVIAFPHGNSTTSNKIKEAEEGSGGKPKSIWVFNGKALGEDWDYVSMKQSIMIPSWQMRCSRSYSKMTFGDAQIIRLCEICSSHRVAFVRKPGYSSRKPTGAFPTGATDHHQN